LDIECIFEKKHIRIGNITIDSVPTPKSKLEIEIKKKTGKIRGLMTLYF